MEKGHEKLGVMFLFSICNSSVLLFSLSEGFDYNIDLHLEQRVDAILCSSWAVKYRKLLFTSNN